MSRRDLPSPRVQDLVFVIPGLWATGGFRTVYAWANRLVAAGCRVRLVAHCGGPGQALLDARVETIVPSRRAYLAGSPARILAAKALGDATPLPLTPAAVTRSIPREGTLITCWAGWLPEVDQVRDTLLYAQHWEPVWFGEGTRARARVEAAMAGSRPTLVNSSWLRQQFPAARRDELELVFPGVDHAVFQPGAASPRAHVTGELRVTALGREEPLKGLAELRDAARQIARSGQPVHLRLFGTAAAYQQESGGVREQGLGALSSRALAALYRDSDVVVTPSWYESFPLPPLEAMACGVPVVTTRDGTEDYAVDGESALVVPPRDIAALTHALERVAGSPSLRRSLSESGRQAAAPFTWDAGYAMFVAAIDRATGGSR